MGKNYYRKLKQANKDKVYTAWNHGLPINSGMPLRFTLNTSHACNLRCIMCQYHRNPVVSHRLMEQRGELNKETFLTFADEVFPTLIEAETTTVGEPFLSSYFDEIIEKAMEYEVKLYITTNGSLLTEKNILKIIPIISTLVVSIDSASKDLYEKIRVKGSYDRLITNINRFVEIKNTYSHFYNEEPQLTLQMTLMRSNIAELPKMVELASQVGAKTVKAYHAYIYDQIMLDESLFFHKRLCNRILDETRRKAVEKDIDVFIPKNFTGNETKSDYSNRKDFTKPPCLFLWTEGFLEPTGEISACFFPTKITMGSLLNNSFQEIWNNDHYQSLRKSIGNEPSEKLCKNCELRFTYLPDYNGPEVNESQFHLISEEKLDLYRP